VQPFARNKNFWRLVLDAMLIGLVAGFGALAFVTVVRWGTDLIWPDEIDYQLLGGEWWWIGIVAVAGLIVALLRMWLGVPKEPTGSFPHIQQAKVDYRTALQTILVSAVSLIGGASLGPFDAGTRAGGAFGNWYSDRRELPDEMRRVNTLSGISGGVGALLTAPFIATLFVTEIDRPVPGRYYFTLIPNLIAAAFGFFVFFAIMGVSFLDIFAMPPYDVEIWHFGVAILLGAVAAALSGLLGLMVHWVKRLVVPFAEHSVVVAVVGGAVVGGIAFVFPLTVASGKAQLSVAADEIVSFSAAFLIAVVLAKILAMAVSLGTGFIGGPVMPTLFIGGTAGLATWLLFPDLPIALVFSCLLVAVPGATVKAPFSMILLALFMVGVGPVESAPAGVAVLTAYLLTSGLGLFGTPAPQGAVDPDDELQVAYRDEGRSAS
jgi:H+/Cl- antiporter ClcA